MRLALEIKLHGLRLFRQPQKDAVLESKDSKTSF